MARITILDREFIIPRYSIAQMKLAAPFIDRINAAAGSMTTVENLVAAAGDFIGVLAIGLVEIDPTLTAEHLASQLSINDLTSIRDTFVEILSEGGMRAPANDVSPLPDELAPALEGA